MSGSGHDGVSAETLRSISTPDRVESRLGTLEFRDGAPTKATAELLYDHLDFVHGMQAFINAFPGASLAAIRQGFLSIGVQDNEVLLFSELMDSASLFLTGNSDTVYFLSFADLTAGPVVLDVPPLGPPTGILGTIDDMWFQWVTDFGLPGPDRGQGGRYLIVGPGYDGPLPDSGFHVSHARTTRVCVLGRAFMVDNDPRVPVETIRSGFRISPYVPGAQGTAVATFLAGKAPLGAPSAVPETRFVEGSGVAVNTIPPNDFGYWETINALVQQEPAGAGDPETMGLLAAVGIVKGQPFKPGQRMRNILEDAVAVGNATARTISFAPRPEEGFSYYPGSAWINMLFTGGYRCGPTGRRWLPSRRCRRWTSGTPTWPRTSSRPRSAARLPGRRGRRRRTSTGRRRRRPAGRRRRRSRRRRRRRSAQRRPLGKAHTRDSLQALSKLGEVVDGNYRIVSQPPIVVPARDLAATYGLSADEVSHAIREQFRAYRATLQDDRRHLLERFQVVDMARKVVGVGSVGTRAFIVLLKGRDAQDPLFLQIKEATASVLEPSVRQSRYRQHGERVVQGQRMMQAASDIYLGWTKGLDVRRHFYWRQLRDMKGSAVVEAMTPLALTFYARICGWTLARAHARSGDPIAIAEYLGASDAFDKSITDFSQRYADQNERDYQEFVTAIRSGRLEAAEGV